MTADRGAVRSASGATIGTNDEQLTSVVCQAPGTEPGYARGCETHRAYSPLPNDAGAVRRSPDGSRTAAVEGNDKLTITTVKTGEKQSFTFHEDDRRFVDDECFQWVSPRYLLLHLNLPAFLAVQSMKMSYPLPRQDETHSHSFSPDFQWVVWQKPNDGIYLGPVVIMATKP